jgi:hypothetical protein
MPPLFDEARIAVAGYLARYPEGTRRSYASDLCSAGATRWGSGPSRSDDPT